MPAPDCSLPQNANLAYCLGSSIEFGNGYASDNGGSGFLSWGGIANASSSATTSNTGIIGDIESPYFYLPTLAILALAGLVAAGLIAFPIALGLGTLAIVASILAKLITGGFQNLGASISNFFNNANQALANALHISPATANILLIVLLLILLGAAGYFIYEVI
jgi:Flp pilus assembly pilin Flp